MTDAPTAPGTGLLVYQPATVVVRGTCSPPRAVVPSPMSRVRTPMAGMTRRTGRARGRAVRAGSAAFGPAGAGTSGIRCRPVRAPSAAWTTTGPAIPMPVTNIAQVTTAVAGQPAIEGRPAPGRRRRGPVRRCRPPGARWRRGGTSGPEAIIGAAAQMRGGAARPPDLADPGDAGHGQQQHPG